MRLTPRQQEVYDFIRSYLQNHGRAPAYDEIRKHFGFGSFNAVQKHLKQLEARGYIRSPWGNRKRAIELVEDRFRLPLLGTVAAGRPIEAVEVTAAEMIEVPGTLLGRGEHYVLRASGESMIGDGIRDGDLLVIERRETAVNGETVVALVNGCETTVKRFYRKQQEVELRPSNPAIPSIIVRHGDLRIRGIVRGLIRRY